MCHQKKKVGYVRSLAKKTRQPVLSSTKGEQPQKPEKMGWSIVRMDGLIDDMKHCTYGGFEVAREIARRRQRPNEGYC